MEEKRKGERRRGWREVQFKLPTSSRHKLITAIYTCCIFLVELNTKRRWFVKLYRKIYKISPSLKHLLQDHSFIHLSQTIFSLTSDIFLLLFFFDPPMCPWPWTGHCRSDVHRPRCCGSVKTRCGRSPSLWGLGFRAVITWEDSGIRWKPTAVAGVCLQWEKERIEKIKGWVVDSRVESLCLTFVCKEVHICVPFCICVYMWRLVASTHRMTVIYWAGFNHECVHI